MEPLLERANQATLGVEERVGVYQLWNLQVKAYMNIVRGIEGTTTNSSQSKIEGFKLLSLPTVEGQSVATAPAWTSNPPCSAINLYFVGVGSDASLAKAKDRSLTDGREQIARAYALRPPYSPSETLINIVQSAVLQEDIYYRYDKGSAFTFFTLLRIARNLRDVLSPTAEFRRNRWLENMVAPMWCQQISLTLHGSLDAS
jgi:hypothetical protein